MRYGYFDNERREYVIDRVDVPVSWTNYIGLKDMYGVFNHTAGGYLLYKTPEYHRITRFRPNGVPMDGPGHYVYLRDQDTGDYWSISCSLWATKGAFFLPPRPELYQISLRLRRHRRRAEDLVAHGRPRGNLGRKAAQRF